MYGIDVWEDISLTWTKHFSSIKLGSSAEICRNRNKSWPVAQCYRMPINTQWNLLTAHLTPTTLSSLLKHFPEENMPHSSNHFITHCLLTSVRLTKHALYTHTCWRHLQGSCCLLDLAQQMELEQMERKAGGGEQARTGQLCDEHLEMEVSLFFSYSLLICFRRKLEEWVFIGQLIR